MRIPPNVYNAGLFIGIALSPRLAIAQAAIAQRRDVTPIAHAKPACFAALLAGVVHRLPLRPSRGRLQPALDARRAELPGLQLFGADTRVADPPA